MSALITADYIGWNHNMGTGSWILMALFWALVIAGVVWLIIVVTRPRRADGPEALDVLGRRLAAGEISVEEYRERREALLGGSGPATPATPGAA